MQTKRAMYLLIFASLFAWIVAQLQVFTNPNNWASFKMWHFYDWLALSIAFTLSILLAIYSFMLLAKTDKQIERIIRDERQQESHTYTQQLITEIRELGGAITNLKTEIGKINKPIIKE
jgi:hypothetical protein